MGWLGFDRVRQSRSLGSAMARQLRVAALSGRIIHLDEVLTMSARMAAVTGESSWEKRYREHESRLDSAIEELSALSGGELRSEFVRETDAANRVLVEIEHEAFRLAGLGQKKRAVAELGGTRYLQHKALYVQGLEEFLGDTHRRWEDVIRAAKRAADVAAIGEGVAAFILFCAWLLFSRFLAATRASDEAAVRNRDLEHSVGTILNECVSPSKSAPLVMEEIGSSLGCDYGECRVIGPAGGEMYCAATWSKAGTYWTDSAQVKFKPGIGLLGGIRSSGRLVWSGDLAKDDGFAGGAFAQKAGPVGGLGVPFKVGAEILGGFIFIKSDAVCPDAPTLETLEYLGNQIGQRIKRMQTETERDRNREFLRRVIDSSADCIKVLDLEGNLVSMNQGGQKLLEIEDVSCYLSRSWVDFWKGADRTAAQEAVSKAAGGQTALFRGFCPTAKGAPKQWEISVSPINGADGKAENLLAVSRDITASVQAEADLRRLKTAIEHASEGVIITDPGGTLLYVNPAALKATGYSREELLGQNSRIFKSGKHDEAFYRDLWETISSGRVWSGRIVNKRKDGSLVTKEMTISPVHDTARKIINYVAVKRDISENLRLEEALRQSQKMESVGRLAGGVAHDFNNILTANQGFTGFVLEDLPEGDRRREDLKEVMAAGERAARLTRQLLAFSRRQILEPEVLDLNLSMGAIVGMLTRLIGEDVKLVPRMAAQPCLVEVDAGQIEQVFLNLAVNARDAMPKGGTLTFETSIVPATDDFLTRHPDMPRGRLVCLEARDTGCGMTDEVKAKIFEPFFTTKGRGEGTGLGLSTVYGIIKQSGGEIEVESAPGSGTAFRIYLPQIGVVSENKDKDKDNSAVLRGNETILLIEDEDVLRRLGERALSASGYKVLAAANGLEARKVMERHGRPVDLLVTDVVMPGMSGREIAAEISSKRMSGRTLYVSGYTNDAIVKHGVLEPGLAFLNKPFIPETLLRKIRAVLDGPAEQAKA